MFKFLSKSETKVVEFLEKKDRTTVLFLAPYVLLFITFIVIPVGLAFALSFTYFNGIQAPRFNGIDNYLYILTEDEIFMKTILPNTLLFSFIVGPGGYMLSFMLAWILSQITPKMRTFLALIIYSPSMTAGVAIAVVWKIIFSGNEQGLTNSLLLRLSLINEPLQFLQNPDYLMPIMILVSIWSSMGVGFLAILAGLLNVNKDLYEAAYIDGLRNRFQEIFYITIPSIKKQMMFSAVMSIVGTFSAGAIGVALSGANPTPQNSGQMIINHIEDYGILRSEMGVAAALSVLLLLLILGFSKFFQKILKEDD
ncbi:MAG: ABC transporter permease [Tenericutes bacterium GWC2_34_14]|nr:MAG: ABC transporter permease [Tenericutes bacterium GWC2_34_14]OHE35059.1 MAG: ABC transporter permease [Tenericutes bacterium GWE2_34_108]OHE37484.1 MAG: ABC transporter permease [Tenericutes bacterium GWF1_35_14]OHE39785.1 MAG: ABC transporter permease [Tenericutes bacterium GWF2_35_184]OHE44429.1 MAG: ABC transporter permease [Tenericutes bacterium RIFOXYA2_FULL_36_32]OHE45562.1 MAG: ABC transporter permease [Tenericutes bacterium RIFOXYA12_FULL_35_10]OHE47547.1 MAG: ABC transporter pe